MTTLAESAPAASAIGPDRTLRERLTGNPVVLKELRGRMRGNRAFVVLTVYLALLGVLTVLIYLSYTASLQSVYSSRQQLIGKFVFGGVVGVELFLVCFIAPAFTAGAISGERERQTYDLLRTTLLPARSLVLGKLTAALSYIVLLLFAAIPLQSLAFLLGGVALEEVLISLVVLLTTALAFGTVGIFFSSVMRRTLGASVMTYAFALVMTLGLPLLLIIAIPLFDYLSSPAMSALVEALVIYGIGLLIALNPLATAIATEVILIEEQTAFFFQMSVRNGNSLTLVSPWIVYVLAYMFLSLILIWISIRAVRRIDT